MKLFLLTGAVFLLLNFQILAQNNDSCPNLVQQALSTVGDVCSDLGRNQACYGHNRVIATTSNNNSLENFDSAGDRTAINDLASLSTAPMKLEDNIWGVAVLAIQANLPDTLPGQNVILVLFGDTEIENMASPTDKPMQVFQLKTGVSRTTCAEVPGDGLLVQAPHDTRVQLQINNVNVTIGSTGLIRLKDNALVIDTFDGQISAESGGDTRTASPGYEFNIVKDAPPSEAEPYDYDEVRYAPVSLLPERIPIPVVVPGNSDWVDSGITVQAGQTFEIKASGRVNPCVGGTPLSVCRPQGPAGLVNLGTAREADPNKEHAATYPMPDATVAALVGRIGDDGQAFLVGDGGSFTAEQTGVLQFRINDEPLTNNDGAFIVIVRPAG